ncbi:hypothetical protein [Luteimonas rhizosphaerae]|nr:hypothetical protein [Luteimonas sp. 4-12]
MLLPRDLPRWCSARTGAVTRADNAPCAHLTSSPGMAADLLFLCKGNP